MIDKATFLWSATMLRHLAWFAVFGPLATNAIAGECRIYFVSADRFDTNDAAVLYSGTAVVQAMLPYRDGLLTAFSNAGGQGNMIYWTPNALPGGPNPAGPEVERASYNGKAVVRAMIEYKGGVLTAFANAGGKGNMVYWTPDGRPGGPNPAGPELERARYNGSSPVEAMCVYKDGVFTALSHPDQICWSPDGTNLDGAKSYGGTAHIRAMLPYKDGLLSAFSNAGGQGNMIYWTPDGRPGGPNPAGPELERARYNGASPVEAMTIYGDRVLTAFSSPGPNKNRIHWSPDGQHLGGVSQEELRLFYDGRSKIITMVPYKNGLLVAVHYDAGTPWCVSWFEDTPGAGGGRNRIQAKRTVDAKSQGDAENHREAIVRFRNRYGFNAGPPFGVSSGRCP